MEDMCNLHIKFTQWEDWLFGEDIHSIQNEILRMIWDSAVFLSIRESRKHIPKTPDGLPELNDMVHTFIDQCFYYTQAMAIRRLLDTETREGNRSVISLYRLIHDMEQNADLLTRKNVLYELGYPYDYENQMDLARQAEVTKQSASYSFGQCAHAEITHKYIDTLAGVNAANRKPDDTVRQEVFSFLKSRFSQADLQSIYTFRNKFLAHAADPNNRPKPDEHEAQLNLDQIQKAHKVICETASFMGLWFFNGSFVNLPAASYNQFEHFEKPWVMLDTIPKLYDFWQEYEKTTQGWDSWDWETEYTEYKSSMDKSEVTL